MNRNVFGIFCDWVLTVFTKCVTIEQTGAAAYAERKKNAKIHNGKSDRGIPKRSAENGTQTRNEYISIC